MSSAGYHDFGNDVRARIHRVSVLGSSFRSPHSRSEVETAFERYNIQVGAKPEERLFAVIIQWYLESKEKTPQPAVEIKVLVEYELEDFERVFDVAVDKKSIRPKLAVDKHFFGIAFSTMRGVAVARLVGTPWHLRIPSLVSEDDLSTSMAQKHKKTRSTATKKKP